MVYFLQITGYEMTICRFTHAQVCLECDFDYSDGIIGRLLEKVSSVLSYHAQKISEQIHLDKDILDLLNEIEIALDLAPKWENSNKISDIECEWSQESDKNLGQRIGDTQVDV